MADSFRLMQRFWLDLEKPDEYELAESIATLKQERSFSRAIRQGLRLWVSLRNRDTSVLFELFPWIQEALQTTTTPSTGNSGSGGYDDTINALQETVASQQRTISEQQNQIRDLIIHQENPMLNRHAGTTPALPAPKAYAELTISDDDIGKATYTENANYNMLINSASMGICRFEDLPPDVLRYGVERGKVPAKFAPKILSKDKVQPAKTSTIVEVETLPIGNAKAMQGANIAFDAPAFDDIEIGF